MCWETLPLMIGVAAGVLVLADRERDGVARPVAMCPEGVFATVRVLPSGECDLVMDGSTRRLPNVSAAVGAWRARCACSGVWVPLRDAVTFALVGYPDGR